MRGSILLTSRAEAWETEYSVTQHQQEGRKNHAQNGPSFGSFPLGSHDEKEWPP